MIKPWLWQILAIIRLELRKTFFARRGLWIYLLAFAPLLLFLAHSIKAPRVREHLARVAAEHSAPTAALRSIRVGLTREQVVEKLGQPYAKMAGHPRTEGVMGDLMFKYTDGKSEYWILFWEGKVNHITVFGAENLAKGSLLFASTFQGYFLRLAIFFGCVGIFTNLFRGEMLDKSLHFYLLTPMRREVLLAGKYLTGLLATALIFSVSAGLQLIVLLSQFDHAVVKEYLAGPGWGHLFSYLAVTVLACVGYGSVFLAAGMFFRNPIIPTALVLVWEGINVFLPAVLKKLSLIFYLQSLCPVVPPPDVKLPTAWKLLISNTDPATPGVAVGSILIFTALILVAAGIRARTLEINYSTD
jgi:ABC-type transport system involved in multi-copper enzyme maturation permease subunit